MSLESESLNKNTNINWLHTWSMQVQRVVLSEPLSSQLQKVLDMDILKEWSKPSETFMITIWSGLELNITHFEGRGGWRIWIPWVHWRWDLCATCSAALEEWVVLLVLKKLYSKCSFCVIAAGIGYLQESVYYPGYLWSSRYLSCIWVWLARLHLRCNCLQRECYFSGSQYIYVDKGKVLILCHGLSLISLFQYSIWPFSDYDLTNDAAEARSGNYGMSNCLTFEWLLKSIWIAQKPISLSQSSLWL